MEFTRGVPPLVQIALIYFALPRLDVVLNEFWTGVAALTFIGVGYTIEVVRAQVESLGRGQSDASLALGLSPWQTLFLVLLPQALRRILPPLTNELVNVIKASALLSVISVNELTKVANELIFIHFVVDRGADRADVPVPRGSRKPDVAFPVAGTPQRGVRRRAAT